MSNCDFCYSPDPTWEFPAETYVEVKLNTRSVGSWLACEVCAALICKDDYYSLVERAKMNPTMSMLISVAGPTRAREETMRLHQDFKKHRTGEPRPL